jgi:hypothetical protein
MPDLEEYVPTAEEIAGTYTAALDSVTLVNELAAKDDLTDEEVNTIKRNVEHLQLVAGKDYWTTEDLTPFTSAITAGNAAIA